MEAFSQNLDTFPSIKIYFSDWIINKKTLATIFIAQGWNEVDMILITNSCLVSVFWN